MKAVQYISSMLSQFAGKVSEETFKLRWNSCFGADDAPVCEYLQKSEKEMGSYICGKCGCGERKQIPEALGKFPFLVCPLGKPGFSESRKRGL